MLLPAIQPQAVCDERGLFISTFMGYPSSVHNVRVLKNSRIFKEALFSPLKYIIVADGGYPCIERPVAITPHREPLQGRLKSHFNQLHAKACSIIEWTFGMPIKCERLLFFSALEINQTFLPSVITTCAVLCNICLTAGDMLSQSSSFSRPTTIFSEVWGFCLGGGQVEVDGLSVWWCYTLSQAVLSLTPPPHMSGLMDWLQLQDMMIHHHQKLQQPQAHGFPPHRAPQGWGLNGGLPPDGLMHQGKPRPSGHHGLPGLTPYLQVDFSPPERHHTKDLSVRCKHTETTRM
ncbi:hypothetical protein GJAV_G00232990 [Gymnothorax javanicus]|nr:hypothetical protein GJAV_G00232990 [Gymnothorax javanicus]